MSGIRTGMGITVCLLLGIADDPQYRMDIPLRPSYESHVSLKPDRADIPVLSMRSATT